jgi:hypothetical protein
MPSYKVGALIGVGMFVNSLVILFANSYTTDFRWSVIVGLTVGIVWTGYFAAIQFADTHMPSIDV